MRNSSLLSFVQQSMKKPLAFASLSLLLACSSPANPAESPPARTVEGSALILRVASGGGFVPVEINLAELPIFSLYADGRVITQGPQIQIFPGPALPNLVERKISAEAVDALLERARKAGLTGPDREFSQAQNVVADLPTTTFTVVSDGKIHKTSAYALSFLKEVQTLSAAERKSIEALEEFNESLGNLEGLSPGGSLSEESFFKVERARVYATPRNAGIVEEQIPVPWPLEQPLAQIGEPVPPEGYRCAVLEGADLATLLGSAQKANQQSAWSNDKNLFTVVIRPLLPDETGCVPGDG